MANGVLARQVVRVPRSNVGGPNAADPFLENFPVLFSVQDGVYRGLDAGGLLATADAGSLRFVGDDLHVCGTLPTPCVLSFEVDTWNASSGALTVWVKLPRLTTVEGEIDSTFSVEILDGTGSTAAPGDVFDGDYAAVWHMSESPGGAPQLLDSTSGNRHGTAVGMDSDGLGEGVIGGGWVFDGADDMVRAGDFKGMSQMTIEGWVLRVDDVIDPRIVAKTDTIGVSPNYLYSLGVDADGTIKSRLATAGRQRQSYLPNSGGRTVLNTWHHVAVTYDGRVLVMYLDGVARFSQSVSGTVNASGTSEVIIGGNQSDVPIRLWKGRLRRDTSA